MTASIAGGFYARYSNSAPVSTGILSLGSQPYCAWHYAIEGTATPLLTDVAYALASKVTSTIFSKTSGWLGWGSSGSNDNGSQPLREKQTVELATPIYPKFGLADALREAISVAVSPNEKLAAVIDSLGRIILIDVNKGIATRIWKGYRDAQCGWVVSRETSAGAQAGVEQRTAAFLVIYIAKRGLMEIWTAQQGTRVAAFNCSKSAKLLKLSLSMEKDLPQCCLLSPDGKIEEVLVPFHCALKGDSSQKARDLHVLQQLRNALQQKEAVMDFGSLLEMRYASSVNQGLDLLLDCRKLDAKEFLNCVDSIVEQYGRADALDAESRLLLSRSRLLSRLVRLYIHLKDMQSRPPDYDTATNSAAVSLEDIGEILGVGVEEISRIVEKQPPNESHPSKMNSLPSMEMHAFLAAFELSFGHGSLDCIRFKSSLPAADRHILSGWICGTCFSRNIDLIEELVSVLKSSMIVPGDLVFFLVTYWLNLNTAPLPKLLHFHKLLAALCQLAGWNASGGPKEAERNTSVWQNIRDLLSKSSNLEYACSAALVCRSILTKFEKNQSTAEKIDQDNRQVPIDDSFGEWEDMSIDMVHWNELSKQLEDLSHLSRLVHYQPQISRQMNFENLKLNMPDVTDNLDFSLTTILQKGRGSVTELVARWLTKNLLPVDILFDSERTGVDDAPEMAPEAESPALENLQEVAHIRELFGYLSLRLPNSTDADVIRLSTALEYAAMWVKNPKHSPLLQRILDTVIPVRANLLRHGICRTLWSLSLSPIFHDLAVLMDKTGRLPKSFSNRKINLPSPDHVAPFLEASIKLLDTTITSSMSSEMDVPPMVRYDDIWPTCEGATPILEVAVRQRLVNIDLVLLHLQLAQSLLLMTNLEIKGIHALSLFDQRAGRFAFFQDLHSYPPLPSHDLDPTVTVNQLFFLKSVIAKAVEMMEHSQSLALDYVNQAVKLGYEWKVDVDELRIKYIHLLYLNGMDDLAHEVLPSIDSNEKLSLTLLNAAGARLRQLLKPSDMSALSPITATWLDGCEATEQFDPSPSKTLSLLVESLRRIATDGNDQFIANELHSVLIAMQDTSS